MQQSAGSAGEALSALWQEFRGLAARRVGRHIAPQGLLGRLCSCSCLVMTSSQMGTGHRTRSSLSEGLAELETLVMSDDETAPHRSNELSGRDALARMEEMATPSSSERRCAALKDTGAAARQSFCAAPSSASDHAHVDAFGEAGRCCSICAAETRTNTHFASPCLHSACEQCWETWLKEQTKCMMCNAKVDSIQRYAESLVPLQAHEVPGSPAATFHEINVDLETAGAAVLESLVSIKSSLVELSQHLEDRQSHVQGSIWRMNADTRNSVAIVELLALSEDLEAMRLLLLGAGEPSLRQEKPPFVLLHLRLGELEAVLQRLGDALDQHHADQDACQAAAERGGRHAEPLRDLPPLRTTLRLLQDCAAAVVLAQWKPCASMLAALLRDCVPDMLEKIHRALGDFDMEEMPDGERPACVDATLSFAS